MQRIVAINLPEDVLIVAVDLQLYGIVRMDIVHKIAQVVIQLLQKKK